VVTEPLQVAQCLLPVVHRAGKRHGIQVHWSDHGKHVWFNHNGRRILNFWPSTGRARASGINRQVQGVAYALDLALELLCRDRRRSNLHKSRFPIASRIQNIG
jgi:hypothetical protein